MYDQEKEIIQQRIGYRFRNTDLLRQAFVRRSYSREQGGEDNEVLEFIGDKVLDLLVIRMMAREYGRILEGEFAEFACRKESALSLARVCIGRLPDCPN